MNAPKVSDLDYINFLVAAPKVVSCTEAARVQPERPGRAAHDVLTRLLQRLEPDTTPLWREAGLLACSAFYAFFAFFVIRDLWRSLTG